MIDISKYPSQYNPEEAGPTMASGLFTEDCNLRCTYCFERHNKRHMTIATLRQALDFLCQNARVGNHREFGLTFFGGEPTLCPELIEEAFRYGLELQEKYGLEYIPSMITNGTILTERIANAIREYLPKLNFGVQLSVDGVQEVQDMYRVTIDGSGSFRLVEKNVPLYRELFKDRPNNLSVHGCLNKDSLPHLFESYKFFREEWGIERIWFLPVCEVPWDDSDVDTYYRELGKIYNYIMDDVRRTGSTREIYNYAPLDRALNENQKMNAPCGAGRGYCTITAHGELYPCHHIYFHDEEKESLFGNIWTGIDDDKRRLYLTYGTEDMSCPKDCEHNNCYRCIAVNLVHNGSILSQIQGQYCEMMKIDFYYQKKIRRELIKMGLLQSRQSNSGDCDCQARGGMQVNSVEADFDCKVVYKDFGDCYIVDRSQEVETSFRVPADARREAQQGKGKTVETWKEGGMIYEKVINPDGSIDIFDRPDPDAKKAAMPIQRENIEEKKSGCGGCGSTCGGNEDFEETVSRALTLLLEKVDALEKIVLQKLK